MMVSRRLLKLILAGLFLSCATLYWNLQRDLVKGESSVASHNGAAAALIMNMPGSFKEKILEGKHGQLSDSTGSTANSSVPLVALVSCQDRSPLTMVTLKSVLMLSRRQLRFVIFADRENAKELNNQILRFPRRIRSQVTISILPVEFPASAREAQAAGVPFEAEKLRYQSNLVLPDAGSEWRQLFKPCSAQRLFLPKLLKDEDAVLYVDTDTIFLRPIEQLWDFFGKMNESQMIAAVQESEDDKSGWYPRLARHPFVQPRGINSGVMLLNLTRLRSFHWSERVTAVYEQWRERVVWGDQDIINIVFSNRSDAVYFLPCEWNFRPDHCQYASLCKGANRFGPGLLHGSRAVLTNNKQPSFRAVFRAFFEFSFRKRTAKSKAKASFGSNRNVAPKLILNSKKQAVISAGDVFSPKQTSGNYKFAQANNNFNYNNNNPHHFVVHEEKRKQQRDRFRSGDYDYTAEEQLVGGNRQVAGQQDQAVLNNQQMAITEDDDEDDESSLKERLISPLTIGIFETVNTRCGRFLKAHTKRLTRALYARAKDL